MGMLVSRGPSSGRECGFLHFDFHLDPFPHAPRIQGSITARAALIKAFWRFVPLPTHAGEAEWQGTRFA